MPVTQALYQSAFYTLAIVGLVLWVRALVGGNAQKWLETPARLPSWSIAWGDFLLLPFAVVILLMFAMFGLSRLVGADAGPAPTETALIAGGFGMGIAFIGGALVFRFHPDGHPPEGRDNLWRAAAAGLLALVYFLPVCAGVMFGWNWLLDRMGVVHDVQPIVRMIRETASPAKLAVWFFLVVVVAPLGEELVFRGGLFRFLSNRMRPVLAGALSAAIFTLPHWNLQSSVPLFLLGLALAGVYQKTGRILAPIVLHAAFNLNTMLGILADAL